MLLFLWGVINMMTPHAYVLDYSDIKHQILTPDVPTESKILFSVYIPVFSFH